MAILKCCKSNDSEMQLPHDNYDVVDKPPNSYHVPCYSLASLIWSIVFHCVDVGFDLYTAYSYASTGKYDSFAWTIALVLLSSVIINTISITMYKEDSRVSANARHSFIRIVFCILGTPVQAGLLIRYLDSLWYAWKSLKAESQSNVKQQQKYFNKMLNEDSDAALLRVFECYLESAPQLILQATLLIKDYSQGQTQHQTLQLIVISLGFIAMGLGMANYHRCIRLDQQDKQNISVLGIAVQFFWHLNLTVSRVLAVTAMATLNTFWTCVALVCHWCVMTVWIAASSKTTFCGKHKILKMLFYGVIGLVYIFNFLNLNEGPTRQSYVIFFSVCFVENLIAAAIWGVCSMSIIKNWVYYVFIILPVFCFLLSLLFLIVYYQFVHPTKSKGLKVDEVDVTEWK